MNDTHKPRPEFVSYLEWQVRTACQRRDRFAEPAGRSPMRGLRMAALVIVSILCGAAGVTAKDQIQEARNKESLLAQIRAQMQVAEMSLTLVRAHLQEVQQLREAGAITEEEVRASVIAVREAETEYARLQLDLEEVQITGEEPQNRLTAPLVGGRDFVTERLRLKLSAAQTQVEASRQNMARIRRLEEEGLISSDEVLMAMLGIVEAENEYRMVENYVRLRRQFLEGSLTAEQTEYEKQVDSLRRRLAIQEQNLSVARRTYEIDQERFEKGEVSEAELLQTRLQLVKVEAELQIVRLQLEQLISSTGQIPPDRQ